MTRLSYVLGFIGAMGITALLIGGNLIALPDDLIFKDGFENHPPVIVSTPKTSGRLNLLYTYDLDATDSDGDLLLYGLVLSPDGMVVDELTGEISWTPGELGIFPVEVLVSDGNRGSAVQAWQIEVTEIVDSDQDGLSDEEEVALGTDPQNPDSDNDGLKDGEEVFLYTTDPLQFDTDGDDFGDGSEIAAGTDPLDPGDYPELSAPDPDPTITTTIYGSTEFLYSGENPIQTGVEEGAIDPERAAVVRGSVLSNDGSALPGATISVHEHPEFGETVSLADGLFSMAINGGSQLTINYHKPGFLPAQRQVNIPVQDYVWAPEVMLIPLDPVVTPVEMNAGEMQVASGSVITDSDGTRQATLLFQAGTTAELLMADGSTQAVSSLDIRATEYTVGVDGPQSMPAMLPSTSGYTYAVEMSADEALAAGAKDVLLSQPVYSYVEDFIDFPVGTAVPSGYYDREKAQWIASENGRVIKILAIVGDLAELDTDGDDIADDAGALEALNISVAEQQSLAGLYSAGQVLWRVPVTHFTPWDYNWPYGPPAGATGPSTESPISGADTEATSCEEDNASVIECQNQVLGERIPVVGTPYTLNYRSDRVSGRVAARQLQIPLSGDELPPGLDSIELEIEIAGQIHTLSFAPATGLTHTFEWDGLDAFGRTVTGVLPVTVRISYEYPAFYYPVEADFEQAFAQMSPSTELVESRESETFQFNSSWSGTLASTAPGYGLGSWTLDVQHSYAPQGSTLYRGDGRIGRAGTLEAVQTVAGDPDSCENWSPEGPAVTNPCFKAINWLDVGPDGSVYIPDSNNYVVWRVGPGGVATIVAGTGYGVFNGDGVPATDANMNPEDVAVGAEGSLYIVDGKYRVRRVGNDGIITTVAGDGTGGFSGDGGPATEAQLGWIHGIALGPDGSLYISDNGNKRIRRVGPDGIITSVAGNGFGADSGDGGPATEASFSPYRVAVGPDGSIYINSGFRSIRRVRADGIITTFAGPGHFSNLGDGGPATEAYLNGTYGLDLGPDGSIHLSQYTSTNPWVARIRKIASHGIISTVVGHENGEPRNENLPPTQAGFMWIHDIAIGSDEAIYFTHRDCTDGCTYEVYRVGPVFPGLEQTDFSVPSKSGSELYVFNAAGRHLRTVNSLTGTDIRTFGYDSNGLTTQIVDAYGNVTIIERAPNGTPTAIVGPYGQSTALTLDANGYLATISNPAGEAWQFGYTDDGLLTSSIDPNLNPSAYTYDTDGRLTLAEDAAGGSKALMRSEITDGFEVTKTTGLGRTTTYRVENLSTGDRHWLNTMPNGLSLKSVFGTDGSQINSSPDGTVITLSRGPDPRFGMQSPVVKSLDISTPGGLTQAITMTRTVMLSDPDNPLSLTSQTDTMVVNGKTLTSTFDAATGQLTSTTPVGRQFTETIDSQGRVVKQELTGLAPEFYTYDPQGRLTGIASGTGDSARTWGISYDTDGHISTITDPILQTIGLEYDDAGRLERQVMPDGRDILLQYDNNGNLTALTPPDRPVHAFSYTAVNLFDEYVPPNGDAGAGAGPWDSSYSFDIDRQRDQVVHPDGVTITFDYDTAGRLNQLTMDRGISTFEYNPSSGYVSSLSTPEGNTLTLSYDASLVTAYAWTGEVTGSISQEYDDHFRVVSRSINGSDTIAFSYDDDGLLIQSGATVLTRDFANGFLTDSTLGNVSDSTSYNEFGERATYTASYNATHQYSEQHTRDKRGRIISRTVTVTGVAHTYEYFYDLAGRLEEVKKDSVTVSTYAYDSNGNRLSHNGVTGSYDDQDRLLQYGSIEYTYTANGDLETRTDTALSQMTSYDYDAFGNLMEVTLPDGTVVEYVVDGLDRRIGKKVNGTLVQTFLYKDGLNPIAELNGNSTVVSIFVYASKTNIPDYMVRSGNTYRIVSDHLGSPRMVIDTATGVIAQQMEFDEFGNIVSDSNPGFQPFGFAGGLYDADTQLVRFGARDYDASIGRWTARDPILFAGRQLNLYVYVANDPVNLIDPSGLGYWGQLASFVGETVGTAAKWWKKLSGYEEKAEQAAQVAIEINETVTDPTQPPAEQGAIVLGCGLRAGGEALGSILPWMSQSAEQLGEIAAGTLEAGIHNIQEYVENKLPTPKFGKVGEDADEEYSVPLRFSQ